MAKMGYHGIRPSRNNSIKGKATVVRTAGVGSDGV